jgi:hypothetical protein
MDKIKIKDREFIFKIPSAWDGCAIYNMLSTYEMPFGASFVIGLKATKQIMPPDELEKFLKLCFRSCYENTGAEKPAHVVDADGEIGIIGAASPLLVQIATQFIIFFIDYWQSENS